jgi:glycosyl transferase family 25
MNNQENRDQSVTEKYIGGIIYINLDRRTDRRQEFEDQAKVYNLNCERFTAIPKSCGIVGCTYSHLSALKIARERNYKNVLIMEDDFVFLVDKEQFEREIEKIFAHNVDFVVCMISYNLLNSTESAEYPFLLRALDVQTASGYIVNQHYYDKLINLLEYAAPLLEQTEEHWNYANDQVWKQYQPHDKWYCTKTRIGRQRSGYSDNCERFCDYQV